MFLYSFCIVFSAGVTIQLSYLEMDQTQGALTIALANPFFPWVHPVIPRCPKSGCMERGS